MLLEKTGIDRSVHHTLLLEDIGQYTPTSVFPPPGFGVVTKSFSFGLPDHAEQGAQAQQTTGDLKVQSDIRLWLGTAQEHVPGSGLLERFRVINNRSGDQTRHAGVTDPRPA